MRGRERRRANLIKSAGIEGRTKDTAEGEEKEGRDAFVKRPFEKERSSLVYMLFDSLSLSGVLFSLCGSMCL